MFAFITTLEPVNLFMELLHRKHLNLEAGLKYKSYELLFSFSDLSQFVNLKRLDCNFCFIFWEQITFLVLNKSSRK